MKKKLIPKHQIGQKILKGLLNFGNAQIAGDSGAATSVAIASGYQYNPSTRRWEQSEENVKEAEGLRNNLAFISSFSDTYPVNVAIKGLGYLFKWRPFFPKKGTSTTVFRQGNAEILDDAIQTGYVQPESDAAHLARIDRARAAAGYTPKPNPSFEELMNDPALCIKRFNTAMFNKEYPFYPKSNTLFHKTKSYPVTLVGDMKKSSAVWE